MLHAARYTPTSLVFNVLARVSQTWRLCEDARWQWHDEVTCKAVLLWILYAAIVNVYAISYLSVCVCQCVLPHQRY
jgi:hypothetical protein